MDWLNESDQLIPTYELIEEPHQGTHWSLLNHIIRLSDDIIFIVCANADFTAVKARLVLPVNLLLYRSMLSSSSPYHCGPRVWCSDRDRVLTVQPHLYTVRLSDSRSDDGFCSTQPAIQSSFYTYSILRWQLLSIQSTILPVLRQNSATTYHAFAKIYNFVTCNGYSQRDESILEESHRF